MREFFFSVNISPIEVQNILYSPGTKRVSLITEDGLRLELPISHFQKFVTYSGIQGRFRLILDGSSFVSLDKC